ncbi:outer membrane protein assembly factor BamB family protein [Streptomyces justiciae]|uniref:outer membrane protein assembly factor BamB family protein n=1 Tax=Streptomyces justiciae TaxID=2780140 RepID=UPI002117FCF0|nr:PQQ-binding-like beta-propeller repeat protein [Streptomyces justiciae]MCW8380117.1 PQQ-binding-like beta-propeller repeat protein [Streptomyces justiciae]
MKLAKPQPEAATPTLAGGTLYFTLSNGGIRAVDPDTGRQLWEGNSGVELAGPPNASLVGDALYVPYGLRSVCTVDVRTL